MSRPPSPRGRAGRSGPSLAAVLLLLVLALPVAAQPPPRVELTLRAHTTAVTADHPLRIQVTASNPGSTPYGELALSLWIYHATRSRTEYAAGLTGEPPTTVLTVRSYDVGGVLAAGAERELPEIEQPVPELAARGENALYPVKVQLQSGGTAIAELRASVVFVAEEPLVPLNVSMSFLLAERVRFRPDGTYVDDGLERSIAPGGTLDSLLSVLEGEELRGVTLVVSPLLPVQLEDMADGYRAVGVDGDIRDVAAGDPAARRAAETLGRLRSLARSPTTEIITLPYAESPVPTLLAGGLGRDLRSQIERGREEVARILSITPSVSVFRPPGSVLTETSAGPLYRLGVRAVVLDHDALEPATGLTLSPPATTAIRAGARRTIQAVAPDPGVAARLETHPDDARLRAEHVLGELTALYLEQPSVDRGVAMILDPERVAPLFVRTLLRGMLRTPGGGGWLRPVKVARLLLIPGVPDEVRALVPGRVNTYSQRFLNELRSAREAIVQLRSMIGGASDLPQRLRTRLLIAEASEFVDDEASGLAFVRSVLDRVRQEYAKIRPPTRGVPLLLTSRAGAVPLTITNLARYPATVRIVLSSPRLEFPDGETLEVELPAEARTQLDVEVRAEATGRFPLRVVVETPRGARIASSVIPVRSTAYSRVALLVTVGAAVFLALWWGRRALRTRA